MAMTLNGTIHIIDDDPIVRDSLALLLTFLSYQTRAWRSGEQFLTEQSLGPRDIVLVDMIMPGEDGFAVIRALRDKNLFNPAILMTGDSDPALATRIMADHCTLLSKPFSKDSLQEAISKAASGER
jgi:FixJ family two-component response regulator